ncbi:MAG TPA: hypothetical protein VGB32_01765 [Candidatus Bathyarchaeia archaeon]
MGTTKQRKERLQQIIEVLKAAPEQEIIFRDLYAPFVLKWGITQKTMQSYVEGLADAGIVDFGFTVITPGTFVSLVGGEGDRKRTR